MFVGKQVQCVQLYIYNISLFLMKYCHSESCKQRSSVWAFGKLYKKVFASNSVAWYTERGALIQSEKLIFYSITHYYVSNPRQVETFLRVPACRGGHFECRFEKASPDGQIEVGKSDAAFVWDFLPCAKEFNFKLQRFWIISVNFVLHLLTVWTTPINFWY